MVLLTVPPITKNNFRDYAEPKATYTKEELLNIIRRIRADVEQTRNQLAIA